MISDRDGVSWGRGCTADNCGPSAAASWRLAEARQVTQSTFWEVMG